MSLFDTLLGEEVGRADAVKNDEQNIFLKQRYLKLQREGKFDEAVASLQPGYVPSEEAASAASSSGASGPLSTSPEIQGLLTAARRSQEEAAQANVGRDEAPIGDHQRDEGFGGGDFPEKNIYDDYTYEDLSPLVTEKDGTVGQLQTDYRRRQALEKEIPGLFSNTLKGIGSSVVSGGPAGVAIGLGTDLYNTFSGKYDPQRKELAELQDKVLQRTAMGNLQAGPDITGYNTDVPAPTSYTGSIGDMDPMSQSLLDAENPNRFGFGSLSVGGGPGFGDGPGPSAGGQFGFGQGPDFGPGFGSVSVGAGPGFGQGPDVGVPSGARYNDASPVDLNITRAKQTWDQANPFPNRLDYLQRDTEKFPSHQGFTKGEVFRLLDPNLQGLVRPNKFYDEGEEGIINTGGSVGLLGQHPDAGGLISPNTSQPQRFSGLSVQKRLAEMDAAAAKTATQAATVNAANKAAGFSRPDEEDRYEPEVSDEEYQDMFG